MPRKHTDWKQEWGVPGAVARIVGLAPQTLHNAIQRGDIETEALGCGTRVVRIADVRDLKRHPRRVGRPRSAV